MVSWTSEEQVMVSWTSEEQGTVVQEEWCTRSVPGVVYRARVVPPSTQPGVHRDTHHAVSSSSAVTGLHPRVRKDSLGSSLLPGSGQGGLAVKDGPVLSPFCGKNHPGFPVAEEQERATFG